MSKIIIELSGSQFLDMQQLFVRLKESLTEENQKAILQMALGILMGPEY